MPSEWMPIESAPKDGSEVDLWTTDNERTIDAVWNAKRKRWEHWGTDWCENRAMVEVQPTATHWRYSPTAPDGVTVACDCGDSALVRTLSIECKGCGGRWSEDPKPTPALDHPVELGDLPSRLDGWVMKARAKGYDTIELDVATVDRITAALLLSDQEPVAYRYDLIVPGASLPPHFRIDLVDYCRETFSETPLYAHPTPKEADNAG